MDFEALSGFVDETAELKDRVAAHNPGETKYPELSPMDRFNLAWQRILLMQDAGPETERLSFGVSGFSKSGRPVHVDINLKKEWSRGLSQDIRAIEIQWFDNVGLDARELSREPEKLTE